MRLSASGNRLTLTLPDRLVSGSINVFSCYFDFDSSWDGYFPTAVFESTLRPKRVEQAVINGECLFPFELLDSGARVRVGIYGVNGDKRRPTTYAEWMPVAKGTETGGSAETPPSPTVYESILVAITDGRLVGPPGPTGADGPPGPDGYSPTVALTETESGVRVSVQNKDDVQSATVLNGKDGAPGKDGVGIQSVTQTTTSTEDGGTNIVTVTKTDGTTSTFEVRNGGGGGTTDHAKLKNRDAADQHPMSAITGLEGALAGKQPTGDYLTEELDPTVPEWAKQPQKPAYTAQEVGALPAATQIPSTAADVNAEPSGAVSQHNVSDAAHSDLRLIIQGLSERLSAVADSDDATLDQLSEIVAYIKSNRDLISAITTSKVNVADIVDNLTTNAANKPLSAAQGVAIKAIIDALTIPTALSDLTEDTTHRVVTDTEKAVWNAKSNFTGSYNDLTDKPTIPAPYTLPIASYTVLGGVQPVAKTDAMTQSVGVDENGALWTPAASGGGGGSGGIGYYEAEWTLDEGVASVSHNLPCVTKNIVLLNLHMTVPTLTETISCRIAFGSDPRGSVELTAGSSWGANIFLMEYHTYYMGFSANSAKNNPQNARPVMPNGQINVSAENKSMGIWSNTGTNFPKGTTFKLWTVYKT